MTHSFPTRRSSDRETPGPVGDEGIDLVGGHDPVEQPESVDVGGGEHVAEEGQLLRSVQADEPGQQPGRGAVERAAALGERSEEHTSELQSLMRNSYAVFCLKQKTQKYQLEY